MERIFKYIAWFFIMAGFILILQMMYAVVNKPPSRVVPPEQKEELFKKAKKHIFVGVEGKRPFMIFREQRGKTDVWCPARKIWIKI